MSKENLERFYQAVAQNSTLQRQLNGAFGWDNFPLIAVELGQQNGYTFTPEEVEAYLSVFSNRILLKS